MVYPWDPASRPSDAFYHDLVMAADSVLDVGCGTGSMLHYARDHGHVGRLVGLDPDPHRLGRAERRTDITWVRGTAAEADTHWRAEFALATMASNAFQCLVTDEELRRSLAAILNTLRPGGGFAFETRDPRARAWEQWNPSNFSELTDAAGRPLTSWHEVQAVLDDRVTFSEAIADPDGTVLRVDSTTLRFLDVVALRAFLTEAGFEIEAQYGDFRRGPSTETSKTIVTIARRPASLET